jgi:nicotinamidase/pyrazinamidase
VEALVIVDVQNDFCPGGALEVKDGDAVIAPLNKLASDCPLVIATRDWHPPDHRSFIEHGGTWPVHCVQGTPGAELREDLDHDAIDRVIDKGQDPFTEGYSAFEDTELEQVLRDAGVDRVHIGGLALDVCVKNTALDAERLGFDAVVHRDAARAVNAEPGDEERTVRELEAAGVTLLESSA